MYWRISRSLEVLTVKYLNQLMDRGHSQWVYKFSSYWGTKGGVKFFWAFYCASSTVQDRLLREFGYHECPSCYWATKLLSEHFEESPGCRRQKEGEDKEDERIWSEVFYQEQEEARQAKEDWESTDEDSSTRVVREDDAEDICEICGDDRHWCSCADKYGD